MNKVHLKLYRNRYAIISDYLDGAMEPFRLLQYDYYRKGLDEMANNAERGRTEITTALALKLQKSATQTARRFGADKTAYAKNICKQ